MKTRLAQLMVCPLTGEPLSLRVAEEINGEVIEGELTSPAGVRYSIRGGIPRMLSDEHVDSGQKATREAFSAKWQRAPDFGHEEKSRRFYVEWYLERYEFRNLDALGDFLKSKKKVLDAGTGTGRDSRLYGDLCPGEVFGVDISTSIESAYDHLKNYSNIHLIQADLTQLPFPDGFFDFIACDQVLHHTRNTEESFHRLVSRLARGGHISIYVYKKKGPIREFADDYLRHISNQMSEEEAWRLAERLTELGRALSELNAAVTVPDIPELGIKAGTYDVQRFIYWHMLKCYWNATLNHEDSVITNFDWYRPLFAHRHTAEEVKKWFEDAGLEIVTFHECEAGISVRGHKG